jgi:hypothetical protein
MLLNKYHAALGYCDILKRQIEIEKERNEFLNIELEYEKIQNERLRINISKYKIKERKFDIVLACLTIVIHIVISIAHYLSVVKLI